MTKITEISPQEAQQMVEGGQAVFLDVRENIEVRAETIVGAHHIPLSSDLQAGAEALDHGVPLVVYCRSGNRSSTACAKLSKSWKGKIYNMQGGLLAWVDAGLPTEKRSIKMLPLDRQMQLVVSLMILVGLGIYHTTSVYGLLLPLMAGLGLLNAALTGWCGMMKLLAIMPWNK